MQIWFPVSVAAKSYYTRKLILDSLNKTADNPEQEIEFKHHSFAFRGTSSHESAEIGGMAELLFSKGTDTIAGILGAMEYYDADVCGYSIAAAEHATITSWNKDNEVEAYRNMIKRFGKPGSIFAVVSDSYDIFNACEHLWGEQLKDEVINSGALVVIRPDSGDPVEVVSKCLHILDRKFGSVVNSKGYKVLNNVRMIQGDGIDIKMIGQILDRINGEGFSTTNIAFGQGGGSLQKINRDTFKMAIKCSCVVVNGEEREVFKSPITDKMKHSKRGVLDLVKKNGKFETVRDFQKDSELRTVYENGELKVEENWDTIRSRAVAE